jgi:hypothetical protein
MAKRKAAKKKSAKRAKAAPAVVKLAERLGSFLGRVRKKADSLLPGPPRKTGRATKAKKAKKAKR